MDLAERIERAPRPAPRLAPKATDRSMQGAGGGVLRLQRLAGNAAVTRVLQREEADFEPEVEEEEEEQDEEAEELEA